MQLELGVRSDVGLVRTNNEDHFAVDPDLNLCILCDGMGGQAAGEVASKLGVNTILEHCRESERNPSLEMVGEYAAEFSRQTNRLASAIRLSNSAIFEAAARRAEVNGMGSTVVAVQLRDNVLSVAHVGDSRAYLFRKGEIKQITQDHSLVAEKVRQGLMTAEEAEQSELSNVILRALGAEKFVEVDMDELWVEAGDAILLCSDGLTRMVADSDIARVLRSCDDAQQAADALVELANQQGGEDNITVIVGRVTQPNSGWKKWMKRFTGGSGHGENHS